MGQVNTSARGALSKTKKYLHASAARLLLIAKKTHPIQIPGSFQRALQGMPCGTLLLAVPVSTMLVLPQLEATLSIHCSTAAVLIIFGDSFVSNLNLKCAICTGYELISKSRWMNVLYLNKLFVEYKT